MAGSLNKVMLIGRLGKDPELKYTQGGTPKAEFSIATDESWTDRDGNKSERTEWHRIVVWSKQAELCANYLQKGRLVFVEGRIQSREYEDQQGVKRRIYEIKADAVKFLDSKGGAPAGDYGDDYGAPRAQPPRQNYGGGRPQQQAPQQQAPQQKEPRRNDDLGPAFPSEAQGIDDMPF